MTKLNTVQNGKGSKIRKETNLRAYWESDYWKSLEIKKSERKMPSTSINIVNGK